jgi:hypothetical protein
MVAGGEECLLEKPIIFGLLTAESEVASQATL